MYILKCLHNFCVCVWKFCSLFKNIYASVDKYFLKEEISEFFLEKTAYELPSNHIFVVNSVIFQFFYLQINTWSKRFASKLFVIFYFYIGVRIKSHIILFDTQISLIYYIYIWPSQPF